MKFHHLLFLLLFVALVIIDYKSRHKTEQKTALRALAMPVIKLQLTYTAWATIYHPTAKECGWDKNIQASGTTGSIGTCACSQLLFDYNVNMFDTIQVLTGSLQGKYVVTDKAGSKTRLIDIWSPVGDSLQDCYKTKFRIIKNNN